jgi:capsular polysaccharide biosynthesis protein
MNEYGNETELVDYLSIIWKRKWLIIIPTFLVALFAGIYSFLMTPQWEIDTIIQPSKFFIQMEGGGFEEFIVVNSKQIAGQINQGSYDRLISAELNIDPRSFYKLKAESLRDTSLVKVTVKEENIERGKAILISLFNHLKRELDQKVDVEMKGVETEIKLKEYDIRKSEINIKNFENQIASKTFDIQSNQIEKERMKTGIEIMEEMKSVKTRIDEIDQQLLKALAQGKQANDAVSLLLYSNEVQQNLRYLNTLDERLSLEKITQENLRLSIRDKQEQIRQIDTQIGQIRTQIETDRNEIARIKNIIAVLESEIRLLEDKKARIDYAQLIKEPTSSLYPVSPRKKVNVVIAGAIGLFMFTIFAFFLEYIEKNKTKKE